MNIGDQRPAGNTGPAGDQRPAGSTSRAGDTRQAGETTAKKKQPKPTPEADPEVAPNAPEGT